MSYYLIIKGDGPPPMSLREIRVVDPNLPVRRTCQYQAVVSWGMEVTRFIDALFDNVRKSIYSSSQAVRIDGTDAYIVSPHVEYPIDADGFRA